MDNVLAYLAAILDNVLTFLTKWKPLAPFLSVFATFVLAIVAVCQDRLRARVYGPGLDLERGPFYSDSRRIPITDQGTGGFLAEAVYVQIPVINNGPAPAEKVEVFIARLEKEHNDHFRTVDGFYPLNLKWGHYNTVFLERLSPKTRRYCTLGRIVDPSRKKQVDDDHPSLKLPDDRSPFRLELAVIPNTRSDLLAPGKYRLLLEIGASNVRRPRRREIELEFTGEWLQQPRDMVKARRV